MKEDKDYIGFFAFVIVPLSLPVIAIIGIIFELIIL